MYGPMDGSKLCSLVGTVHVYGDRGLTPHLGEHKTGTMGTWQWGLGTILVQCPVQSRPPGPEEVILRGSVGLLTTGLFIRSLLAYIPL